MARSPSKSTVAVDYCPEQDVQRLADFLKTRYGSLDNALKTFDHDQQFELYDFEAVLKKWGFKVDSVVQLFDHIDADWSGKISVEELFMVLELPIQELQDREKWRQKEEVKRTFEQLAKGLRAKYHSVEEAVGKYSQHDPGGTEAGLLSLARFRTFVNSLGLHISAAQLQRVFYEIDQNRSGTVSISELQQALSNHLAYDSLKELAEALADLHNGDLEAAFKDLGDFQQTDSEEKFLRLLRQLRVFEVVTEDMARLIFSVMSPNLTIEKFVAKLKEVHQHTLEEKARQKEQRKRIEKEKKKLFRQAMHGNSRQSVEEEVQEWTGKVVEGEANEQVTYDWGIAARGGKSKTQLKDYVAVLKSYTDEAEGETRDLRTLVENEERDVEVLRDFMPAPSPTLSATLAWSGEVTPITPSTPYLTPANRTPSASGAPDRRASLSRKSKAERAEKLIQAASMGNIVAVQSCLSLRVDINAVAWGGVTALMSAAHHGREAVLEVLLANKADILRTDVRGRTAVDHAFRQPRTREWLRCRGGLSSKDLEADAQALARLLLEAQEERTRLQAQRERLPSREVREAAKLRQAQRRTFLDVVAPDGFGMPPQWPPPGTAPATGVAAINAPVEPCSPISDVVSPGVGLPMRSALASGAPGAPKHVRLDCLPPRR